MISRIFLWYILNSGIIIIVFLWTPIHIGSTLTTIVTITILSWSLFTTLLIRCFSFTNSFHLNSLETIVYFLNIFIIQLLFSIRVFNGFLLAILIINITTFKFIISVIISWTVGSSLIITAFMILLIIIWSTIIIVIPHIFLVWFIFLIRMFSLNRILLFTLLNWLLGLLAT